jgi:PucR C-terminal helix-turn-helix domain/GGDEF-like domain
VRQVSGEQGGGAEISERLRERRSEIEATALARVYAVSEPPPRGGPEYAEGLRAAISAALDYGLAGIELGDERVPSIPEALLAQARLAARSGVSLDTVLRRYLAGHTLLDDFLIEEAQREGLDGNELMRLLRSRAAIVDRLLVAASKAYAEAKRSPEGAERRRAERIERLLAGERLDTTELFYDFETRHIGIVVSGQGALRALTDLAKSLDARLLAVRTEVGDTWAWLGSPRSLDPGRLERLAWERLPPCLTLAIGEPGKGIPGWRLSHHQARAALSVAKRSGERVVRYAHVALLASLLGDDLLATSLRRLYLDPLDVGRERGAMLRQTLRAYFAAERNVSSTAMNMKVDRKTVTSRLRKVERRLGCPIATCAAELETALRLHALTAEHSPDPGIELAGIPKLANDSSVSR